MDTRTFQNLQANQLKDKDAEAKINKAFQYLTNLSGSISADFVGKAALQTYVEGTFTPALTFGGASVGITYATQSGFYTRIGRLVHIEIAIMLTSVGSSTGNAVITGLPFTVAATS